jgi:hypothetical protein
MNDNGTTRRRFLVAAIALSGLASGNLGPSMLRISAAWAESGDDPDDETLSAMVQMARLLFPHDGLSDDLYADVLDTALGNTAADGSFAAALDAAAAALDAAGPGDWIDREESDQIDALTEIEGEGYFAAIKGTVRAGLYLNPLFWEYIDYPGSSKAFGGYLNRGAGDIDWLPVDVS